MLLSLYHDIPSSAAASDRFEKGTVLEKLKSLDARARRKGVESLDPARNNLIGLGMEVNGKGEVTKNSYGVFNLSWQAEQHPEWPGQIVQELQALKKAIRQAHATPLRFLIWAGMGGSAEDKSMYQAVGLLRRGPRVYVLDSTDPAKLKAILDEMSKRCGGSIETALKSSLVVGMALGMTSYEPVVNLEKIAALYAKYNIDSRANIIYMTLPDSLLDQFGKRQGFTRVELQLDNGNSTSGRHSAPMTRGSLYPLGLAGVELDSWMESTLLSEAEIASAWKLSAFLHTQARNGRSKVTLLLPKQWSGIGLWTKQNFEESLGKSEKFGLKVVINENVKLANYHGPKEAVQDRCFLAVQIKSQPNGEVQKIAAIRRAGYPAATVTLKKPELARYMQFIHYAVFGVGYLEQMNFVTQPGVELYKTITNRLHSEAQKAGGIEKTAEWTRMLASPQRNKWRNQLTLYYDRLPNGIELNGDDAPELYASLLRTLCQPRQIEYAELTFFGDMRYSAQGKAMRKALDRAGERLFRSTLKMPVDIYEGPAMNHSYHEMIIGHGRCLSTVILSERAEKIAAANHTADYHRAQFLATQMALAERGRHVVAISVKDTEPASLLALDEFFRRATAVLKSRRAR